MKTARVAANIVDPRFFNQVAQIAHFSAWFTLVVFVSTLCWRLTGRVWLGPIIAGVANLVYATWHEYVWDPIHENAVTRGSDFEDWAFLVAGGTVGFLFYFFLIVWR
jgi:hypothetical protein